MPPKAIPPVDRLLPPESTVLDVLDELLNKGVMANGDVTLGVAGIDLIYLRLSALLCAADRILPADSRPKRKRRGRPRSILTPAGHANGKTRK